MKEYKSKKEIEMAIKAAITTEKNRAIKALLRIYEYQTEDEKACGTVDNLNGVGFAGTDAELLTSFCKQFERRKSLTDKQVAILFKKIGKYAGQLTRQAISKNLYVKEGKVWKVNYAAQTQNGLAVAANEQ